MNRINSTAYIKEGASMPTGLDVIGTCFDKEVIANIASAFYQYLCDENIKDLALETDKEKCLLTVTLAKQYIDAIFSIDPLKVAADAMSHVDIHTIELSFLSGNLETEESSVTRVGISTFLNNEKYFNAFVKLYAGKLIVNKDITLTELSAVAKLQNGILDVSVKVLFWMTLTFKLVDFV